MKYIYLGLVALVTIGCAQSTYYIHEGKKETLTPIKERSTDSKDYYLTDRGVKVGVSDTLFVKFIDSKNYQLYKEKYNLTLVDEILPNLFLFKVTDKSLTLKIANELSEKNDIKYSHPNFSYKKIKR